MGAVNFRQNLDSWNVKSLKKLNRIMFLGSPLSENLPKWAR